MADKVIRYKGEFDASQILASLKSIRSEMEKGGAAPSLFKGVDKDIAKAESLVNELMASISTGFKSTKDVDNFRKKFDQLTQTFAKTRVGLNEINKVENFSKPSKALQDLEKELDKVATAEVQVAKNAAAAAKNLKSISTKEARAEIEKAIDAGENLEAVMKKIAQTQFTKGQSSLNKIFSKQDADTEKIKETFTGDSVSLSVNDSITKNEASVNAYRQALLALATTSVSVEDAFADLKKTLDEEEQEYLESSEFAKAYMEDLRNLSLEAAKAGNLKSSVGAVGKAVNTMGGAGVTDTSGNLHMTEKESQAIQEYIDLIRERGRVTQEIAKEETAALEEAIRSQENFSNSLANTAEEEDKLEDNVRNSVDATEQQVATQQALNETFDRMSNAAKQILSISTAWRMVRKAVVETYNDVKELDKAFAEIAMVTKYSVSDMWAQYGEYQQMANNLGQTTLSVIQASGLFYQQGLDTAEALKLTEDTMKLATLAGLDFKDATSQMTAAIRAFHMEMDEGAHVTDVYAEIAAHAAVDVKGLSEAMSACAAIANSAGMSFENTSAMLATMVEATQEAPKNLGTAMKTILARFTELKNNVAGTADSEFEDLDYNKVDKALKSVGISIKDANGQFRNMDEVLLELSEKWNTLDRNSQRYIATIAAGSRQQSRFIALMENYDRTMELVEVAEDSAGRSSEQFAKYQDTLEYKVTQLKNSWEALRLSFTNSDFFKDVIDKISSFVNTLKDLNPAQFAIIGVVFLTIGKTAIMNFIKGLQEGGKGITSWVTKKGEQISNALRNKIGKKLGIKVSLEEDIAQSRQTITKLEGEISQLEQKIESTKIEPNFDTTKAQQQITYLETAIEQLNELLDTGAAEGTSLGVGGVEKQLSQYQNQLEQQKQQIQNYNQVKAAQKDLGNKKQALEAANKTLDNSLGEQKELDKRAAARGQVCGATFAAAMSAAIISVTASDDPMAAVGSVIKAGLAAMISSLISMVATGGMAAVKTFITSTAGIGAAIIAITAAITGLVVWFKSLWEEAEANKFENRMKEAKKTAEAAREAADEQSKLAKETAKAAQGAKDLRKRYEELSNKLSLTEEEQEEYNKLVDQIREEMPEVVTYYNEVTGELITQNELWDEQLKKMDEAAKREQDAAFAAEANAISTQGDFNDYNRISKIAQSNSAYKAREVEVLYEGYKENPGVEARTAEEIYQRFKNFASGSGAVGSAENYYDWANKLEFSLDNTAQNFDDSLRELAEEVSKTEGHLIDSMAEANKEEQDAKKQRADQIAALWANTEALKNPDMTQAEKTITTVTASLVARSAEGKVDQTYQDWKKSYSGNNTFFDALGGSWGGASGNSLSDWGDLDSSDKIDDKFFKDLNIYTAQDVKDLLTELKGSEAAAAEFWEENQDTEAGQIKIWEAVYGKAQEKFLKEMTDKFTLSDSIYDELQNYYDNIDTMSIEEAGKVQEHIIQAIKDAAPEGTEWTDDEIKVLFPQKEDIDRYAYKYSQVVGDLGNQLSGEIYKTIDKAYENYGGDTKAATFLSESLKKLSSAGLSNSQLNSMLKFDWKDILPNQKSAKLKEFKAQMQEMLGEAFDPKQAEKLFEELYQAAQKYDIGGVIKSWANAEEFTNYLLSINTAIEENQDKIDKLIKTYNSDGSLNYDSFKELQEIIDKLNESGLDLDIEDFYELNEETGKITLNVTKLKNVTAEYTTGLEKQFDEQKKINQAKIDAVKAEISAMKPNSQYEAQQLILLEEQLQALENQNEAYDEQLQKLKTAQSLHKGTLNIIKEQYNALSSLANSYKSAFSEALSKGQLSSSTLASLKQALDSEQLAGNYTLADFIDENGGLKAGDLLGTIRGEITIARREINKLNENDPAYEQKNDFLIQLEALARELEQVAEDALDTDKALRESEAANRASAKAVRDHEKAVQDLADKEKALQELLTGSKNYRQPLDDLYNYTTQLDALSSAADRAKDALENMMPGDNAKQLLQSYYKNNKDYIKYLQAENQVRATSIGNAESTLQTQLNQKLSSLGMSNIDVSSLYTKIGDRYQLDLNRLNNLGINDTMKDFIANTINSMNELQKGIEENSDKIRKKQQEVLQYKKEINNKYVSLEDNMKNALKEKYQQEIDDLKAKYEAMETADSDYLQSLEEAINKQRELRERANEWDDLATKEKKLSLMQRDTSGANQLEVQKLEKEVENDRQKLLDEGIDDVINNLKELYDLQKEERDLEIEYRESLLTDAKLLAEITEALEGIHTADDLVNWYSNITDWSGKSNANIEQMKTGWEESFSSLEVYRAQAAADMDDTIDSTAQEVIDTITETSETLTTKVSSELTTTTEAIADAIKKAREDIVEANDSVKSALDATYTAADNAKKKLEDYNNALAMQASLSEEAAKAAQQRTENIARLGVDVGDPEVAFKAIRDIYGKTSGQVNIDEFESKFIKDAQGNDIEFNKKLDLLSAAGIHGYVMDDDTIYIYKSPMDQAAIAPGLPQSVRKFASGGLVNYTGPAWVDGSPSAPEAFLNPEDTRRIGEAARLLADLPALNSGISQNISTSTVGDTTIALTVNFDSISEEYDAERVIDLMKQKIVEAAHFAGSNVILQQ